MMIPYFSLRFHLKMTLSLVYMTGIVLFNCSGPAKQEAVKEPDDEEQRIRLVRKDSDKKVEVYIDGQFFTAYIFPKSIKKPVLFPLLTASGISLTRGFPLDPQPWERVDHPHHVGMWLNHGDTDGLDFWNNSDSIPANQRAHYGTIYHKSIEKKRDGDEFGFLETEAEWRRPDGRVILEENTQYYFSGMEKVRIIDRITTLSTTEMGILFKDSKEGMMAIRVNRALELPENNTIEVLDESLQTVEVRADEGNRSRGDYLNSEGVEGGGVWGQRARWVRLGSDVNGEKVGIIIMDHPDNPNHPTRWHARGYGLFSANPFGDQAYTQGKETFNFFLPAGKSVTLKYRIYIYNSEEPDDTLINKEFEKFSQMYKTEL